jgi:ribosome biogenesis GTPase YqeH
MAKSIIRCFGCGCELQNHDPLQTGYTPKILDGEGTVLCQRCYRLQHYGENRDDSIAEPDYANIFKNIIARKNLILYALDLFNFESSIIREVHPYIKNNPILIVANKRDILPKNVDDEKIKQFIYLRLKQEGIEPNGIIVTSAYKNYNFDEIYEAARALSNKKDIFIIGASSVGKSSIINTFLKNYKNASRNVITTSPYPGTTVATIRIPIDNYRMIIDTPGVLVKDSMHAKLEKAALKYIIPKTELRPITYQLSSKQSICLGGLARFDIIDGPKSGYTIYASRDLENLRCKLEKADSTFNNLVAKKKIKPTSYTITSVESLTGEENTYILPEGKKVDIVVSGLGWISCNGKGQKICVKAPRGVLVVIRDAMI